MALPAPRPLRITTWNINGIRAVRKYRGIKFVQLLESLKSDIICFQETKTAHVEQARCFSSRIAYVFKLQLDDDMVTPEGWLAFYSFSRVKEGYSGVVTFINKGVLPVLGAEEGITGALQAKKDTLWRDCPGNIGGQYPTLEGLEQKDIELLDSEGRCVITNHGDFFLVNLYLPQDANAQRLEFKMRYCKLLSKRLSYLASCKEVIVAGDLNVTASSLDHFDPAFHLRNFTEIIGKPIEKWNDIPDSKWFQSLLVGNGGNFVDLFRLKNPDKPNSYSCWNLKTYARDSNYGTRIDYLMATEKLSNTVSECLLETKVKGSDHCPVVATFSMCPLELHQDFPLENLPLLARTTRGPSIASLFARAKPSEPITSHLTDTKESKLESRKRPPTEEIVQPPSKRTKTASRLSAAPSQPTLHSFFRQ